MSGFQPIPDDGDEVLARLRCFEPPWLQFDLPESVLRRHLLLLGGTGSGKTSFLDGIIAQLVRTRASGQPIALVIIDAKQDGATERFSKLAESAGRTVQVLSPGALLAYDLLGDLKTLDDVEQVAQKLLLSATSCGRENLYWDDTRRMLLEAALTLLLANGAPVSFDRLLQFCRGWFFGAASQRQLVDQIFRTASNVLQRGMKRLPIAQQRRLEQAFDAKAVWEQLDSRTQSNVQSVLANALQPLQGSRAAALFEVAHRPVLRIGSLLNEGGLAIVSVNALVDPHLAKLLFQLVKRDFFRAVQSRTPGHHPLAGLVMDEYPLACHPDDIEHLHTIRSRRGFVISAAQGIGSLDSILGDAARSSLTAAFQSFVFLRAHDPSTNELATEVLGRNKLKASFVEEGIAGDLLDRRADPQQPIICPAGALSQLKPHWSYVSLANGARTEEPVWLEPLFVEITPGSQNAPSSGSPDQLQAIVREVRHSIQKSSRKSQDDRGETREPVLPISVWTAAVSVCSTAHAPELAYTNAVKAFEPAGSKPPSGLRQLPLPWLAGLPGLLSAFQAMYGSIPEVHSVVVADGRLHIETSCRTAPEESLRLVKWLNLRLYPSRWRPLSRRHYRWLHAAHPEMRRQLKCTFGSIANATATTGELNAKSK